eukprot:10010590-Lingulodinium_polyedra.AAC.1
MRTRRSSASSSPRLGIGQRCPGCGCCCPQYRAWRARLSRTRSGLGLGPGGRAQRPRWRP